MFRFTIRDVLWLTVVVGVGIAWAVDRWRPLTASRIKAMLLRSGYYAQDGEGRIVTYYTKDGPVVTTWEFYDNQPLPPDFPESNFPEPATPHRP